MVIIKVTGCQAIYQKIFGQRNRVSGQSSCTACHMWGGLPLIEKSDFQEQFVVYLAGMEQ